MLDPHPFEDDATLYVLDQLSAAERRQFEARLAASAELRALVRELEEGAEALALASPRRQPPVAVWNRIETAVASDRKKKIVLRALWSFWTSSWQKGWAAAAACLIGWFLYALWVNRANTSRLPPAPRIAEANPPRGSSAGSSEAQTGNQARARRDEMDLALRLLQAKTQEIAALRGQVAALTDRMMDVSQTLTRQQVSLTEPSRLRFFQLSAPSTGGPGAPSAPKLPVATNLQRALFLAVARELGWLPSASGSEAGQTANRPEEQNHSSNSISTNQAQVDFVDLRTAATNQAPNDAGVPSPWTTEPASASATSSLSASNAIPGFASGTNTLLAFDSSVATPGSLITFWNTTPDQFNQALGSAVLGTNSLVVTIPFRTWGHNGAMLTVTAVNSLGLSNVLGQLLPAVPGGP